MICSQGIYLFGNDLIEILPFLKKIGHPELYVNDFYIQSAWSKPLFERSVFIYLLHFLHAEYVIVRLLLHLLISLFLIHATFKLSCLIIENKFYCYWAVFLYFVISSRISLGGNEIYYNSLLPSLVAKTFVLYALLYYTKEKFLYSFLFLSIATFLQAAVGFQLWLLLGILSLILFQFKSSTFRSFAKSYFIFGFISLLYLLALYYFSNSNPSLSQYLFEIQEFRNGHHLIVEYSSLLNIIIYLFFVLFSLFLYYKSNSIFYYFTLAQFTILILYVLLTSVFHFYSVFNLFWLKSSIYIEFFAFFGLIAFLTNTKRLNYFPLMKHRHLLPILICIFSLVFSIKKKVNFINESTSEITLSELIKTKTEPNSIFLVPPDFTSFKFLSERNSYIDFKAILQDPNYLFPWYDRIQNFYQINYNNRIQGDNLIQKSKENFNNRLWAEHIANLQSKSIDYIIVEKQTKASNSLHSIKSPVIKNDRYEVFQLK